MVTEFKFLNSNPEWSVLSDFSLSPWARCCSTVMFLESGHAWKDVGDGKKAKTFPPGYVMQTELQALASVSHIVQPR